MINQNQPLTGFLSLENGHSAPLRTSGKIAQGSRDSHINIGQNQGLDSALSRTRPHG